MADVKVLVLVLNKRPNFAYVLVLVFGLGLEEKSLAVFQDLPISKSR